MVSCFKRTVTTSLLALVISCGQDGKAPSLLSDSDGCNPCKMFVNSTDVTGNLSGVTGADATCMADSLYPGTGTYKALLVTGTTRRACTTANCSGGTSEHIDWVMHPNTDYERIDGTPLATTNAAGIFNFSGGSFSDGVDDAGFWSQTALTTDWRNSANDCTGWTSTAGNSRVGDSVQLDNRLISSTDRLCSNPARIICVEQ